MEHPLTAWSQPLRARIAVLLCALTVCLPVLSRSASLCTCSGTIRMEAATCCAASTDEEATPTVASCCGQPRTCCHAGEPDGSGDDGEDPDDAPCCREVSLDDAPTVPTADRLHIADDDHDGGELNLPWTAVRDAIPQRPDRHVSATGPPWDHGMRRRQRERASVVLLI